MRAERPKQTATASGLADHGHGLIKGIGFILGLAVSGLILFAVLPDIADRYGLAISFGVVLGLTLWIPVLATCRLFGIDPDGRWMAPVHSFIGTVLVILWGWLIIKLSVLLGDLIRG